MIFSGTLRRLDDQDTTRRLATVENYIRSMQEQLEYTLYNLDSTNITSLDTGVTDITSAGGSINISGEMVSLRGPKGEKAIMGNDGGGFTLELAGEGGRAAIFLDGSGRITVGSAAVINVDGGSWDQ